MLYYLGLATCGFAAVCALQFLYANFVRPGVSLKKYGAKSGAWAVVTGASDGIGKGFVEELARAGFNLLLISRTEAKLKDLCASIEKEHNVKTKYVAADFTTNNSVLYNKIDASLQTLDGPVGMLVNNVGVNTEMPIPTLEIEDKDIQAMIDVNVFGTIKMTKLVAPGMVKRKQGAIINLSSGSGVAGAPLLSVYAATKAFINSYSVNLSHELREHKVDVLSLTPFFVESAMSKMRRSMTVPSARQFAKAGLAKLGYESTHAGYWFHAVLLVVLGLLPSDKSVGITHNNLKGVRKAALRKAAKKAAAAKTE